MLGLDNKFCTLEECIHKIRKNVNYPNRDGKYFAWDGLTREQRAVLSSCAYHLEYYNDKEQQHGAE